MKHGLRKFLNGAATISVMVALAAMSTNNVASADLHYRHAIVSEIHSENNLVCAEVNTGTIYSWYGLGDYEEGDILMIVIDDKETIEVFDDEVIGVEKIGYVIGE